VSEGDISAIRPRSPVRGPPSALDEPLGHGVEGAPHDYGDRRSRSRHQRPPRPRAPSQLPVPRPSRPQPRTPPPAGAAGTAPGRPVSEYGRLCRGDGGHGRGERRRMAL